MKLKRFLVAAVLVAMFGIGVLVGSNDLPPYPQMRAAYASLLGGGQDRSGDYEMSEVPVISAERYANLETQAEIAMVGDSITASGRWDEMFPEASIINRGVNGDVIGGLEQRTDAVLRASPTKIFVMIGVNDIAAGNSNDQIISRYRRIITALQADGAQVFVQSIIPCRDFRLGSCDQGKREQAVALNRQLKELATDEQAEFIDVAAKMADEDGFLPRYSLDGVHPGSAGFARWREILAPYIESGDGQSANP